MKENKYSASDDRGIIIVTLETRRDEPSAEDFDRLIDLLKERYPELNSETEKETEEAVDKKNPLRMNQKEYEGWRTQEEKRNKKNR